MALLDDAVGGWGGGLAIGVGLAIVAPAVVNVAGSIVVPVARTAIRGAVRGALLVGDSVRQLAVGASEQVSDLVAEVMAERQAAPATARRSRPTPVH